MSMTQIFPFQEYKISYIHSACAIPQQYSTIANSFEEMASKYPDMECYIFLKENKRYTYASFKMEINKIAGSLMKLGLKQGDRFATLLPNCSENLLLTFGASQLGLTKVLINPVSASDEIIYILNSVSCKAIFLNSNGPAFDAFERAIENCNKNSDHCLSSLDYIILIGPESKILPGIYHTYMYDEFIGLTGETTEQSIVFVDSELPLSLFFTSGTTGHPKGVTHTNFGALNTALLFAERYKKYLSKICITTSFNNLLSGHILSSIPTVYPCTSVIPDLYYDAESTMRAIHDEQCTLLMTTPHIIWSFLEHPKRHQYKFHSLQYVGIGSTPIQPQFFSMAEKELGIQRIGHDYGSTEGGMLLSSTVHLPLTDPRRYTSLGQCLSNIELKIVDENENIVPIGITGELMARGCTVMLGYFNDIEQTRITKNTLNWLRIGDIVRMDKDGCIFYVSRKKEIIIYNGINIYPFEVELAMLQHPSIAEAYVFGIPNKRSGEIVCAFVKAKADALCTIDELQTFLKSKLSFNKIPKHIQLMEEFPRTALGKVLKRKLAENMIEFLRTLNYSEETDYNLIN